jgi:hypothetical protein
MMAWSCDDTKVVMVVSVSLLYLWDIVFIC